MAGVVETLATVTDFKRHPRQKYGSAQGFFWWFSEIKRRKTNPRWYHSPEIKNSEIKTRGTKLSSLPDTFSTNASVNAHNEAVYNLSQSEKAQIDAIDVVIGDISDELKHEVKKKVPDDPSKQWAYTKI